MDKNDSTPHSTETIIALLQRDVSYIRSAQDQQSQAISNLDQKIDSTYVTHEYFDLKSKSFSDQLSWHNRIFGFIAVTIGSALLYAFLNLILKGTK